VTDLRYGAFAPQGWKLEYTGWGAADAWARTKEFAQLTESLGYDHLWVYDHVETVPRREATHVFEAFTTLAALAQHTSKIKLGQMVTCAAYRNAGLLAKPAGTNASTRRTGFRSRVPVCVCRSSKRPSRS
jgi:alkanesulfonate monooxygenase SsuD/methylene tetrahydromethanopterin reductase-like flavin-dependent oxidoreductase (luciferase family)